MSKYKVEFYGWEMEAMGFSLTDEQVDKIELLMRDNDVEELWEVRFDMDDIIDIYEPNLFHRSAPFYNGTIWAKVMDEEGNVVLEFEEKDRGDEYENVGDVDELYGYESHLAIPNYRDDGVKNILLTIDENKGGLFECEFESDTVPTAKDFSFMSGTIDTPEGDWDFISKIFFKDKELEPTDWLDNRGKAATVEIYTEDGRTIS